MRSRATRFRNLVKHSCRCEHPFESVLSALNRSPLKSSLNIPIDKGRLVSYDFRPSGYENQKTFSMPRIVINAGTPEATEIQLKPGSNIFGRAPGSDFRIDDPSVSGTHCQMMGADGSTTI